MTPQTLIRDPHAGGNEPLAVTGGPPGRPARLSWRSVGPDLTYLASGFFLTLFSFLLLVPLFALCVATAVLWIGLPILGFTLLTATGFARENRELLRRWGAPVTEPTYRWSGSRRLLRMLLDPHAWLELLHGTVVALPLRIATFVAPVAWLAGALGGLTWFIWGVFLPHEEYSGLAWLLVQITGLDLDSDSYLLESACMAVSGLLLLATAPLVTRLCATLDAGVARALLGGHGRALPGGAQR